MKFIKKTVILASSILFLSNIASGPPQSLLTTEQKIQAFVKELSGVLELISADKLKKALEDSLLPQEDQRQAIYEEIKDRINWINSKKIYIITDDHIQVAILRKRIYDFINQLTTPGIKTEDVVNTPINDSGETLLHKALKLGLINVAKFLIFEANADLKLKDKKGLNALHYAALSNNGNINEFIISLDPDLIYEKNNDGKDPLQYAIENKKFTSETNLDMFKGAIGHLKERDTEQVDLVKLINAINKENRGIEEKRGIFAILDMAKIKSALFFGADPNLALIDLIKNFYSSNFEVKWKYIQILKIFLSAGADVITIVSSSQIKKLSPWVKNDQSVFEVVNRYLHDETPAIRMEDTYGGQIDNYLNFYFYEAIQQAASIQSQINDAIRELKPLSNYPKLNHTLSMPINSWQFQMAFNFLLKEIEENGITTESRRILLTMIKQIANNLKKIKSLLAGSDRTGIHDVISNIIANYLPSMLERSLNVKVQLALGNEETIHDLITLELEKQPGTLPMGTLPPSQHPQPSPATSND